MMRNILKILLLCYVHLYFSQGNPNLPQITPPSMDSYKLGIYGNMPVGLFTGSPNYQIHITSLKLSNYEVPISLTYTTNGIKVDEPNGNVGLGWTLNAGGVISVLVRDLVDDSSQRLQVPDIENTPFADLKPTLLLSEQEQYDSESDLNIANVNGISFKFIIKEDGEVLLFSQQDLKIAGTSGFTDSNGVKYYLDEIETTTTLRPPGQPGPPSGVNVSSAFYLSRIKLPNSEEINFEYETKQYTTNVAQNQIMKITPIGPLTQTCSGVIDFNSGRIEDRLFTTQSTNKKQLKKIKSANQEIEINYSNDSWNTPSFVTGITKKIGSNEVENFSFFYIETIKKRRFLEKIKDEKKQNFYEFQYIMPHLLPEQFNFSQDIWGFYNGKTNNNLIPKDIPLLKNSGFMDYGGADRNPDSTLGTYGLLKKIIYPTKGSTEINYERNTIPGTVVLVPAQENSEIKTIHTDAEETFTLTATKDEYIEIIGNSLFAAEDENCLVSAGFKHKSHLSVTVNNQNVNLLIFGIYSGYVQATNNDIPFDQITKRYIKAKKGDVIVFTITKKYICTDGYAIINYTHVQNEGSTTTGNKLSDGYRISQLTENPENESTPLIRKFNYNGTNGLSNGRQLSNPFFISTHTYQDNCYPNPSPIFGTYREVSYRVVNSSSISNAFRTHANFFYSNVDEYIEGKGKTTHFFTTNSDIYGRLEWGNNIMNSTMSNTGWDNGKEYKTIFYDNTNNRLKEVEYIYIEEESKKQVYYDLITKVKYEPVVRLTGNIDHLDIMSYKNISHKDYLKSQITTDFLGGKPLVTKTEYFYISPAHYQPTSQRTEFSDKTLQETKFSYAHEKGNTDMIAANMVGIHLETEVKKFKDSFDVNPKTISKSGLDYAKKIIGGKPLILPDLVYSYDLQNPSTATTEVKYNEYDDKGNILQYTLKPDSNGNGGNPVAIIWGYNQTQPIAKVEGIGNDALMAVSGISALITDLHTKSAADVDAATEQSLITALDNFRKNSLLAAYQITTYTYNPLVGVTSITPPSGIREYYNYDTANRLESVKDVNRNVLKEYEYHYKP